MRVTLKTVNDKLVALGTKTELAKGAGYFLFRGGEAEEWIDRTVRVPTISSLTLDEWVAEYERLKALHVQLMKASKPAPPKVDKKPEPHGKAPAHTSSLPQAHPHGEPAPQPPAPATPSRETIRDSAHQGPCTLKAKLLSELNQAHKGLLDIEEQEVHAAKENRIPDLVTLLVIASREREKFDRALLAIRDHTLVHGC
jgi:hypothetical protein